MTARKITLCAVRHRKKKPLWMKFVSPRIRWFRRKDEWWKNDFPDTNGPQIWWGLLMMLKGLLEICERESVKKSKCGLSCWLILPAASKRRERMCALSCWLALSCYWPMEKREKGEKWLAWPFMFPWGGDLRGLFVFHLVLISFFKDISTKWKTCFLMGK